MEDATLAERRPGKLTAEAVSWSGDRVTAVGSRTAVDLHGRLGDTFPVVWTSEDNGHHWTVQTLPGLGDAHGVAQPASGTVIVGSTGTRYAAAPPSVQTSQPTVWSRNAQERWVSSALPGDGDAAAITDVDGRLTVVGASIAHSPETHAWATDSDGHFSPIDLGAGHAVALAADGQSNILAVGATDVYGNGAGRLWDHIVQPRAQH